MIPPASPLRLGTRGSPLALWQTRRIAGRLAARGILTRPVEIVTSGDLAAEIPLARLGTPGVFSKELDQALLAHRIDLAVHSLKDLPSVLPEGILLAAVAERTDPRDALIGRGPVALAQLPANATVATCSLRRQAQLRRLRPDLRITDLRGNIETRLRKLDHTPEWDAIVLAVAGLTRLDLAGRIGERISPDLLLPAPGQAALAVTARSEDAGTAALIRTAVNDDPVERSVLAERAVLQAVGGGCQLPVGALGEWLDPGATRLRLRGRILSLDGRNTVDGVLEGRVTNVAEGVTLGARLARQLLVAGGGEILRQVGLPLCASV